jgi:hypothetical protein
VTTPDTRNEFGVNLHAKALGTLYPVRCLTKQSAYRVAAWFESMAEVLPDEENAHTYEEVREAIRNT